MVNVRASLSLLALGASAALVACGSSHESFFSTPGFIEPTQPAGAGGESGEAGEASIAGAPSAGASVGGSAGAEAGSGQGGHAQAGAAQGGSAQGGAAQGGTEQGGAAPGGSGGSGGSGGAPPLPVVGIACQNKLTKPPPAIGDFEQNATTGWGAYINNYVGIVQLTGPGAAQTAHAATFAGAFADQSGLYHGIACSDVTGYDGITFWAKGRGGDHVRFLAAIPETQPVSDGGDCDVNTKTCWDHPGKLFVLTNQWQRYTVAWSELAQYGWGSPASFGHVINTLTWINDGYTASFEWSIDQVSLYKGSPE